MKHVGILLIDEVGTKWRVIERFHNGECVYGALNESNYILSQAVGETIEELIIEIADLEEVFFVDTEAK